MYYFSKNEIVVSRLPINLYITIVPITNSSAYTTIVKIFAVRVEMVFVF